MADDVVLNKAASIERCIHRLRAVHSGEGANLFDDLLRQESILLNLQRACETAIDLAMHVVRVRRLGVPQDSREAFSLLAQAGLIEAPVAEKMRRMVGFRNIAVHQYRSIDLEIVERILTQRLDDFLLFTAALLRD